MSAEKRTESAQDAPLSISVVNGESLAQNNIETLSGLESYVPNVSFTEVTGTPQIYVRGVGGGGRNVGFAPRVGVYVDGVYIGNTASLDAVLVGLDRVEVLRGPQGFLFGEDTDAGAISLVTKAPDETFSAGASVAYGTKNDVVTTGHINVPIADDVFGNLTVSRETRDGFITNYFDGSHPDDLNNLGVRGRLRIDASNSTTVDLAADYSRQTSHLVVGELLSNTFGTGPSGLPKWSIDQRDPELDDKTSYGLSATVAYSNADFTLTSISAYRYASRHWITDTDHSPLNIVHVDYLDTYSTYSQELRIASADPAQRLRYLAGIYIYDNESNSDRAVTTGSDAAVIGVAPFSALTVLPNMHTLSYALYASLDYDILPDLTLSAGFRASNIHMSLLTSQNDQAFGNPDFFGFRDKRNEGHIIPTVNLTYKPAPNVMAYAKFSEGVKSGGFNADISSPTINDGYPYQFSAENVKSYEGGVKTDWFDGRLRANLSVFLNDFSNYQVFQFFITESGLQAQRLVNAGQARTYGPELEIDAQPIEGLTLSLQGAWLSAIYTSFRSAGGVATDYTGNQLEYAPKWTLSSSIDYRVPFKLIDNGYFFSNLHYSYRSAEYTDPSNAPTFYIAPSSVLDLTAGFGGTFAGGTGWELSLQGQNLLNSDYLNGASTDAVGTVLGFRQPTRTYLLKFSVNTD